jgi:predicted acyltransferase
MLLVNNPGSWSHIYWPLEHAAWNGWTFTDLVFPFFLFMVGMAMMYSFPKRLAAGSSRAELFGHVVRRAIALMLLGWWGSAWSSVLWPGPDSTGMVSMALRLGFVSAAASAVVLLAGTDKKRQWLSLLGAGAAIFLTCAVTLGFDDSLLDRIAGLRVPGVLVRIAWCYLLASGIYFLTPARTSLIKWTAGLLAAYMAWMMLVPIPGFGMPDLSRAFPTADTPPQELFSNWAFFIDYHVFGSHTSSVRQHRDATGALIWSFDPEGLISTIPATGSVLFGILTGMWMRREDKNDSEKLNGLFVAAGWVMIGGLFLSIWMPINKRIWTSSYTIFTSGMAMATLAMLFHAIDMRGWKRWSIPIVAYGRNAIFAFVASGMMATAMGKIHVSNGAEGGISLKGYLYNLLPGSPEFSSFLFGITFVTFWALIALILDKRRVYFKL